MLADTTKLKLGLNSGSWWVWKVKEWIKLPELLWGIAGQTGRWQHQVLNHSQLSIKVGIPAPRLERWENPDPASCTGPLGPEYLHPICMSFSHHCKYRTQWTNNSSNFSSSCLKWSLKVFTCEEADSLFIFIVLMYFSCSSSSFRH